MGKRSAKDSPAYAERIAARKRLRAVVGWDVRLRDLPPEQLRQAQERAAEPVQRVSLDALAAGAGLQPPNKAGCGVRQGIDAIQVSHEFGHDWIVHWRQDPRNIDLG